MSGGLQGAFYDEHQDYAAGSPHLKHRRLNSALIRLAFGAIDRATEAGHAKAAIRSYRKAASLNPDSPIFTR